LRERAEGEEGRLDDLEVMSMEDEIDLREYFAVMGRRKWTIIGVFLVAVIVAAVLSFFVLPPVYEASLLLQPAKGSGDVYADPNGLSSVLESEGFISQAASRIRLSPKAASFAVKATVVRNTQLVRLAVRAENPDLAAHVAKALAGLAVEESRPLIERRRQVIQRQLAMISRLLETTAKTGADLRGIAEPLLRQAGIAVQGVTTRSNAANGSGTLVDTGRTSTEISTTRSNAANGSGTTDTFYNALLSAQGNLNLQMTDLQPVKLLGVQSSAQLVAPRKALNVALAAVLGLMAGVMLAFFQEFLSAPRPEAASVQTPGTHGS
jgi:capsular polysaccharide biosynthesis protein